MTGMIRVETQEDARQLADLNRPAGEPGSGRVRYAAAMYLYTRGMIGPEALEVYRVCAVIDREDPRPTLARLGLAADTEAPGPGPRQPQPGQ